MLAISSACHSYLQCTLCRTITQSQHEASPGFQSPLSGLSPQGSWQNMSHATAAADAQVFHAWPLSALHSMACLLLSPHLSLLVYRRVRFVLSLTAASLHACSCACSVVKQCLLMHKHLHACGSCMLNLPVSHAARNDQSICLCTCCPFLFLISLLDSDKHLYSRQQSAVLPV